MGSGMLGALLPAFSVLAGVALTFAGTGVIERQKWTRSRAGDRQDASRRAQIELLQTVTETVVALRLTIEQARSLTSTDWDQNVRSVDELVATARRQATAAYIGCSSKAFELLNVIEREMQPIHAHLEAASESRKMDETDEDADVLVTWRNHLINELRKEDRLPPLEDAPVAPRRTRRSAGQ
jgi:hypothetical protein